MTSKKDKRARGLAKREAFMAQIKEEGLRAQDWDKSKREAEAAQIRSEVARVNERYQKILDNATPEDWERARKFVDAVAPQIDYEE
jgi:hypothetical protein